MASLQLGLTTLRTSLSTMNCVHVRMVSLAASSRCYSDASGPSRGSHADSSSSSSVVGNDNRTEGYGPFSSVSRARKWRDERNAKSVPNVMRHVQLASNINLRLSLSALIHPTQLSDSVSFQSAEWTLAMVRLYRAILRLHNKTVAVPRLAATVKGAADGEHVAVQSIADNSCGPGGKTAHSSSMPDEGERRHKDESCYYLRYLLTEEQRAFGTYFVHREFANHVDADALTAGNFYAGWYSYVLQLASGITTRELSEEEKRLLTEDQQERLHHLHSACISLERSGSGIS